MDKDSTVTPHLMGKGHHYDLAVSRNLITGCIELLEKQVISPIREGSYIQDEPGVREHLALLWGEKENAVSVLVKLTTLLLKLIPLEREVCGLGKSATGTAEGEGGEAIPLTPEENAIVQRFLALHKE